MKGEATNDWGRDAIFIQLSGSSNFHSGFLRVNLQISTKTDPKNRDYKLPCKGETPDSLGLLTSQDLKTSKVSLRDVEAWTIDIDSDRLWCCLVKGGGKEDHHGIKIWKEPYGGS